MKRTLCNVVSAVMLFAQPCAASPYFMVNGGAGGANKAGSVGFEFGSTRAIANTYPLSMEFTVSATGNAPSDLLDYPVPHNDFNFIGERNKDSEYGALVKTGCTFSNNLSVLVGVGAAFQEKVLVAQSNATGWYYTEGSDTKTFAQIYGGLLTR